MSLTTDLWVLVRDVATLLKTDSVVALVFKGARPEDIPKNFDGGDHAINVRPLGISNPGMDTDGDDVPHTVRFSVELYQRDMGGIADRDLFVGDGDVVGYGAVWDRVLDYFTTTMRANECEWGFEATDFPERDHPRLMARTVLYVVKYAPGRSRYNQLVTGTASPPPGTALDDLIDVNAPSPSTNEVLTWDGSEWVSAAAQGGGGGGATELDDLTDTDVPAPTNDQVLKWNGFTSKWEGEKVKYNELYEFSGSTFQNSGELLVWNGSNLVVDTVKAPVCLSAYMLYPERGLATNMHGGLSLLATAQSIPTATNSFNVVNGGTKLLLVFNGTGSTGTIEVSGTRVNRDTGATDSYTETMTIGTFTTDGTTTDAGGNTVYSFTNAHSTSYWYQGTVTITSVTCTNNDIDVYALAYEQFNDKAGTIINTLDFTGKTNNASATMYCYMYKVDKLTGSRTNIVAIASISATSLTADEYYRRRRGALAQEIDGSAGDGMFIGLHLGPTNQRYWEQVQTKVWADVVTS